MCDRKLQCLFVWFICLFQLHGFAYGQNKPEPKDLIHFGDVIDVDIVGSTEFDWRGKLNPEGFLNGLDFINEPILGLCRSEEEVAIDIAKGFSNLLRNPQVVVKILDRSGRPITFLNGAIRKPQRFLVNRQVSLNELIILSGGLTDQASGEIQITRPEKLSCGQSPEKETSSENSNGENFVPVKKSNGAKLLNIKVADLLKGEKNSNPSILNGDIISVLSAEPIYVIGGVVNPKQINARSQMTVSRAIASAGGFSKDANTKDISVFRRENNETKIIEIDFNKIKSNESEDLVLQKNDIVDVAQSGREKRKFPPVIQSADSKFNISEIPLRIIE